MNKNSIVSVIAATTPHAVVFAGDHCDHPVVAWALVEGDDGGRRVLPMILTAAGAIDVARDEHRVRHAV
jgi:hypothetical protein